MCSDLVFAMQMAILAWVRFNGFSQSAPIASTVIIVPSLIVFVVFAAHFYRQLVAHKVERSTRGLEEIENMANQLDAGLRGSNSGIHNV
jgi:calcium release-activated calcium channel protein 1